MKTEGGRLRMAYVAVALAPVLLVGCATMSEKGSKAPAARVEVEEAVGFTITQDIRIEASLQEDYESAVSLLDRGQLVLGIELLKTVVAEAPQSSAARIDLGIAYHRTGDLEAAEEALLAGLELSANHPIAHNELGIIYRESGRFAEAKKSYEAALAVYPGFHFARRNLAVLCDIYLADLNCALENYEAYMATVPSDDEATIWIADLKQRLGR